MFKDEKVYVQNEDLISILSSGRKIPASVIEKIYGHAGIIIITEENMEDFVEFDRHEQVEFFRTLEWIVNYDEVKNLTIEELGRKIKDIKDKILEISNKYNGISEKYENYDEKDAIKYELLENLLHSLSKIQYFKIHNLELALPNENHIVRKLKNKIKER